jgi:hypothetical protein
MDARRWRRASTPAAHTVGVSTRGAVKMGLPPAQQPLRRI